MDPVEKELLRGEIDALVRDLAEARYRHVAGIDASPDLGDAFRRHSRAAHRETVQALRADGEKALAELVAGLRAERAQAADEAAWRGAEVAASGVGPDGPIRLAAAQLATIAEVSRPRRLAFGAAVASMALRPEREGAVEQRARARAEVGLTPDWDAVIEADALLSASDDAYRDVLAWLARREAQLAPPPQGDLARADLLHVLALHGWRGLFLPGMLAVVLERTLAGPRLDLGRARVDEGAREAQWPGAHAFETRVSFRRQGGAADWLDLFDAVGQALAAAAAPPHRRHPAAPFTFGALLSSLLLERRFLERSLGVERRQVPDLVRALGTRQLFRLRANAAAFRVASEVERGTTGARWHEAHRDALTLAAAATWPLGLAARDGDGAAMNARLRGWARAERLRRTLVERLDEDWWRNPRAAAALGSVLAAGGAGEPDEPALRLGAEGLVARLQ
jgi:hypothetical protein